MREIKGYSNAQGGADRLIQIADADTERVIRRIYGWQTNVVRRAVDPDLWEQAFRAVPFIGHEFVCPKAVDEEYDRLKADGS